MRSVFLNDDGGGDDRRCSPSGRRLALAFSGGENDERRFACPQCQSPTQFGEEARCSTRRRRRRTAADERNSASLTHVSEAQAERRFSPSAKLVYFDR